VQKADIIKEVCEALVNKNNSDGIEILKTKYPFENYITQKRKPTTFLLTKIFLRDGFIDRYTGTKLVFPPVLRIISHVLPEVFPFQSSWKMTETHVAYWELFPTVDHIKPIARGGDDTEENIVTTSMIRNAAKSNFTLEEIGWFVKEPGNLNEWDGLTGIFKQLIQENPTLFSGNYIKEWNRALTKAEASK
jgi:hypothetical protein